MTAPVEPISDADLAVDEAAIERFYAAPKSIYGGDNGNVVVSAKSVRGMIARIRRDAEHLAALESRISTLTAALAAAEARAMPEARSMDSAPMDGTAILVRFRGCLHVAEYRAVMHPDNLRWVVRDPNTGALARVPTVTDITAPTIDGRRIPGTHDGPEAWWPLPTLSQAEG